MNEHTHATVAISYHHPHHDINRLRAELAADGTVPVTSGVRTEVVH